jgi:transporter family-2 protein
LIGIIIGRFNFHISSQTPLFAYMGGLFGAVYVVINSYAFTKIGAIKTVLLVISGQMISGIFIDYKSRTIDSAWMQCIGVVLILAGVYLTKLSNLRYETKGNKNSNQIK